MDPQFALASKDDVWRLQNEMKNVYATQAEHADRLARLEQRQEGDARTKSPWGTTSHSPFHGPLNGASQQGEDDMSIFQGTLLTFNDPRSRLQSCLGRFSKFRPKFARESAIGHGRR